MDSISTNALLISLVVLLVISAFFSGSETGMMSLNRYKLRHLVKSKHKGAMRVEALLSRPDRLIGLILIGNNLVNILASSIATVLAIRLFGDLGIALATAGLTIVILIFSEVTPKTLAAMYPEKVAYPASIILKGLMFLLYPLVWSLNGLTNAVLAMLGIQVKNKDDTLSTEELRTVVNEAGALIPRRNQEMLLGILDLSKVTVEEIMVPRNEIYAININDEWKTILRQLTNTPHTKVLLYRDSLDDAVGFVHAREALRLLAKDQFNKAALLRTVREVYYIPEGTALSVQLVKFQRNKERIGLVVDEYGDIRGLTTLDDILEEIVGDFTTSLAPSPSEEIQPLPEGGYLVEGGIHLRELAKELGWELNMEGAVTLNGLILEYLQELPKPGDKIELDQRLIEILAVENNMVKQARISDLPTQENDA
ncbi:HlyC/CorC family transporter [Pseudaeromonas paramecii]|uniref:CNNM domain-containing protein n=1 Tax=Pseudaeromonas paramecii TaxID=2138166 RepID=A0ABP8QBZ3_9GAMM